MAKTADNFNCYVDVRGRATNPDDEGLDGVYLVSVTTSIPVNLGKLTALQQHRIAAAVLDEFHGHQGIEEVDDFSVSVYLENGSEIGEDCEDPDAQSDFSVSADHCGSVDIESLPEALSSLADGRDDEIKLLDIEFYLEAAAQHGMDSEPDHEVGDLQDLLRAAWNHMTPLQRVEFAKDDAVHTMLEGAAPEFFDDRLDDELEALGELYDAQLDEAAKTANIVTPLTAAGENPQGISAVIDLDGSGDAYREIAITLRTAGDDVGFVVVGLGGDSLEPVVHVSTEGNKDQLTHHVYPLRSRDSALVIG